MDGQEHDGPDAVAGPAWAGRTLRLDVPPRLDTLATFAESVVESAWSVSGVRLSYAPDDLAAVDRILESFRAAGSDAMAETVWSFGCYVGQTMVRAAGGVWIEGPDAHRLGALFAVRLRNGVDAGPIGRAFRRVDEGESASIEYFYRLQTSPHFYRGTAIE